MSKKESYWFSHDSNAANNPKLLALIRKYGFEGYGRWWRLLERLRDCEDYKYNIDTPFAYEVIGQDLQMTADEAQSFIDDCIQYFQLLDTDGHYFWSISLLDRMEYWEKRREVLRERGRKGGLARARNSKNDSEQEEDDDTTAEAQASNSLSKGDVKVKLNEANETIQNQTKQNETTFNIIENADNKDEGGKKMDTLHSTTEVLRKQALADGQRFVYPYVSTGRVNKDQLAEWLTAFNKWLSFTGEEVKTERDYRRHFAAWFKYRDVVKEDPKLYNPALAQQPEKPVTKTVPLPVLIPDEPPKGRYKKGDNKYDMHWLKSIRDEVRNIGG